MIKRTTAAPPPSATPSMQLVAQLPLEYEARVWMAARVIEEEYEVDRALKAERHAACESHKSVAQLSIGHSEHLPR